MKATPEETPSEDIWYVEVVTILLLLGLPSHIYLFAPDYVVMLIIPMLFRIDDTP